MTALDQAIRDMEKDENIVAELAERKLPTYAADLARHKREIAIANAAGGSAVASWCDGLCMECTVLDECEAFGGRA